MRGNSTFDDFFVEGLVQMISEVNLLLRIFAGESNDNAW